MRMPCSKRRRWKEVRKEVRTLKTAALTQESARKRKKVLGTGNQNHQIYQIFISQDAQDGTDPARLLAPLLEPNW
jgi:hypothetical protein